MKNVTYNKSKVMKLAWNLYNKQSIKTNVMFSDCLKQAWNIEKNGINEVTIEVIYKKYYTQIFNYIVKKVGNKNDIAEELTQDVFIKVNEHIDEYDVNRAKLTTWFYTIANNKVIDYFRANAKRNDTFINVSKFADAETGKEVFQFTDDNDIETLMDNSELSEKISAAINNLPEKYKPLADLFFIQDLPYNQIAEILEIPLGSVKGYINRMREMLQTSLNDVYVKC